MKNLLLIGTFLLIAQLIIGQDCKNKSLLFWAEQDKEFSTFQSSSIIYALIYSTKPINDLALTCSINNSDLGKSISFPIFSFKNHPKVPSYLAFKNKYFYLLPISPKPYPIQDDNYRKLAQLLLKAKKDQQKEIIQLQLRSESTNHTGCLSISFEKGLGNFNFDMGAIQELEVAIRLKEKELIPLVKDSIELDKFHQRTAVLLKQSENILQASRNDHDKLQDEEKMMLKELITLSDSVGFSLNKAFISNDRAEARKVADITGAFEKRKIALQESPVFSRIKMTFQNDYRLSTTRFNHARTLMQLEQKQAANLSKILKIRTEIAQLKAKM